MREWRAKGSLILCLLACVLSSGATAGEPPEVRSSTLRFPAADPELQQALRTALSRPPFGVLVGRMQLSVALVDLSTAGELRYAGINDDVMRYAASLPKIAILLAAFDQIEKGALRYGAELNDRLVRMIRYSDNSCATSVLRKVGFENVAATLRDSHYRLYDPSRNGGLWVGKDYGGGLGYWKRDPLHSLSHGATARQVARFFVMLDRDQLISPWASEEMKRILSEPAIHHKFVKGLDKRPGSRILRKSGTWKTWHCDAALVERGGKKYVAVALLEKSQSGDLLSDLILRLDDLIGPPAPALTRKSTLTAR